MASPHVAQDFLPVEKNFHSMISLVGNGKHSQRVQLYRKPRQCKVKDYSGDRGARIESCYLTGLDKLTFAAEMVSITAYRYPIGNSLYEP